MKIPILALTLAPLAALAIERPLHWTSDISRVADMRFDAMHGDALDFKVDFNALGKPVDLSGLDATLYWQTNGMGSAWWSAPGAISNSTARALFPSSADPGDKTLNFYLALSGGSNVVYGASARVTFRNSPGLSPNMIAPPIVTIDFNAIEVLNAPWPDEADIAADIPPAISNIVTKAYVEDLGIATKADVNTLNAKDLELQQHLEIDSEINDQQFIQINRDLAEINSDLSEITPCFPADGTPTEGSREKVVTSHGVRRAIDDAKAATIAAVAAAYKPKQDAKTSPSAATTEAYQFIDTVSQDTNGVITATKKTMRKATTAAPGMVQLNDNIDSTRTDHAATANAVRKVAESVTSATNSLDTALREWADGEITIRLGSTNAFISVSNGVQRIYEVDGTNKTLR